MHRFRASSLGPRFALALVAMAGLVAAGCGSGGPKMGRVSGTVTYQGKSLDAGTVTFIATDSERPNASGSIQPGGTYTLQTSEPGDGAVVGDYRVAITDVDSNTFNTPLPGAPPQPVKSILPKQYLDAATSGLTATVAEGSNTKDFELK